MADLNNLGLRDDVVSITGDPSEIPEQPQGFSKTPQPRRYTFKLPANLAAAWQRFDYGDPPVEGISIKFDGEHPLTISSDPLDEFVGETVRTSISDILYSVDDRGRRAKDGRFKVSDLLYFVTKGLGMKYPSPAKNSEKIAAISEAAGREFQADFEWTARCDPKRDIYGEDEQGNKKKFEGVKGCGKRFYTSDFKSAKGYSENLTCDGTIKNADGSEQPCGASIRAFGQLTRFGLAKAQTEQKAS